MINHIQGLALMQLELMSIVITFIVVSAFVAVLAMNIFTVRRIRNMGRRSARQKQLMQHALEMSGIKVVKIDMTNQHVSNLQGAMLPTGGLGLQDLISRIHPDDRENFSHMITQLSLRQKGSLEWAFRWNMAEGGAEADWHSLHCTAFAEGRSLPMGVVCTLTDETQLVDEQQKEQELADRYRLIFDRSVVGLAFYDSEGMLLAVNQNMRDIFHIQPDKDPMFFGASMFRRPPFRDVIDADDIYETHFCTKIVMPERSVNKWVELRFTPILGERGELLYLSVAGSDVTEEREIYLQGQQNDLRMRQAKEEIQRYETELQYLMDECDMRVWRFSFDTGEVMFYKGLSQYERNIPIAEMKNYFVDISEIVGEKFSQPEKFFNTHQSHVCRMRSVFHDTDQLQWNAIDTIPLFDESGKQTGTFGIIRNVTSLIEAQEKLKEETLRANDSARLKSVFMANMTHEIRTPLNAIVGFSDVLTMIDSPDEKQEMIRVIMNNCDMLLRLINDILEVSGMDNNAIKLEPTDVDFALSFNDICETLSQRVQEPGVEFIKDNPYKSFLTRLDPRRVQQVITNFVTNAVKYTHQGHIKVGYRLTPDPSGLYIYCEDTGAGIPKEQQGSVFERFVKLNDYVQGTGLGLSICKAIAKRAGGRIGVESEGEGRGSTFWFWIPCEEMKSEK